MNEVDAATPARDFAPLWPNPEKQMKKLFDENSEREINSKSSLETFWETMTGHIETGPTFI